MARPATPFSGVCSMAEFTLIYRDLHTSLTGHAHVEGNTIAEACMNFERGPSTGDVEVFGAFEGHIASLWWEE